MFVDVGGPARAEQRRRGEQQHQIHRQPINYYIILQRFKFRSYLKQEKKIRLNKITTSVSRQKKNVMLVFPCAIIRKRYGGTGMQMTIEGTG